MTIAQSMLPEFDQEMAGTRRTLARVPWEKSDWKPHAKSMALGHLAGHVAEVVTWASYTFESTELDFATFDYRPPRHASTDELLATFDRYVAAARAALAGADDAAAMAPWTLRQGDQVFFTLPRIGVVRSMVMNHMIHHRAQLGVYLRLLDLPVPGLYGPSADEQ